ncbi:hypothetical protein C4561_01240 [candidate division WWE3 bacterium]|jgi:phosphoglycerol transferase|uniref:Glycosyltransferase RgtA/B/C/D-like domain-containing protein n=1 Tax=candidate division WWE3 bacterium TaxID=2053526 RepID=A0A3A4ZFJ2_UNCKA|nr:MAG: hypothetical protein C4561_01240 [candidate division WWE3 bacterium]
MVDKYKEYALISIVSIISVLLIFKYFNLNPLLPLNYSGDALVHYNFAKNIQVSGWWTSNPYLGAPGVQSLNDFPLTELLHILLLKTLILFGLNWYQSVNIFYILSFPLTAVISMYAMRRIGIKTAIAFPLSLIYTFIPYHFYRGVNHLFLAAYYTVPISILSAYLLASEKKLKPVETVVFPFVIASAGGYYTYFSLVFLGLGIIIKFIKTRKLFELKPGVIFLSLTLLIFMLNMSPTLIFQLRHGSNLNTGTRLISETELYGLKIIQLLLPVEDHNLSILNKVYKRYGQHGLGLTITENQYSSLGLISSVGFLLLLAYAAFGVFIEKADKNFIAKINIFSIFNLTAVLFGTIGGFSLFLSSYMTPVFRSVNRISIFIAFFSLVALGLLIQKYVKDRYAIVLVFVMLSVSLYDQISIGVMRNFRDDQKGFLALKNYAYQLEGIAGKDSMIYTLPYGHYPEGEDKKIMRLALLTDSIKWSAGAETWRAISYWQYNNTRLEIERFLENIIKEGFTGLVIHPEGYDQAKVEEIKRILSDEGFKSYNDEFVYFDLKKYAEANNINKDPTKVFYYIGGKCVHDYTDLNKVITKYWCVDSARINFENRTSRTLKYNVNATLQFPAGIEDFSLTVEVKPGYSTKYIYKAAEHDGAFPLPGNEIKWPLNIGYPNMLLQNVIVTEVPDV